MNGIRITLYLLLLMHVLPFVITELLILEYPFHDQKRKRVVQFACTVVNVLLNGVVLYLVLTRSGFDLLKLINFTCSYQDISRLATSNVITLAASVVIGLGLHICVCEYFHDEQIFYLSNKRMLLFSLAAIPVILGYYFSYSGAAALEINEICRKTTAEMAGYSSYTGDKNDSVCYVSVANNGVLAFELDQIYLSDNKNNSQKQQVVQKVTLRPGRTYRIYMPSANSLDIKKNGGSVVCLVDKLGNILYEVEVPALQQDESYKNMGTDWQIVNLAKEVITVPAPLFSREGGFYDSSFMLELTAEPETTIYYTLDSSDPTVESTEYSGSIYVYDRSKQANRNPYSVGATPDDKCFVVRAVAADSDGNLSDIITKSYFIGQDKYKDRTVISLVSDPDGLFGDNGIYVAGKEYDDWYLEATANAAEDGTIDTSGAPTPNYLKHGIEWERKGSFEVFENAELLLAQQVGLRIQGGSARSNLTRKRFSIYARDEYGSSDYFDVNVLNEFSQHSLYTRQGDMHAISQLLGQDRDVATAAFIPVDVFLDGEFLYTTYLFEKFNNEKNMAQKYGLSPKNVVVAKYAGVLDVVDGLEDGVNPLSGIADFITENNLANQDNYQRYSEILDIQSYIDWLCINMFMQNLDYNERANNMFWHTVVAENDREGDTRWRLGLYDMDLIWDALRDEYGSIPPYAINPFTMYGSWQPGPPTQWPIYSSLRRNENFCKQFVLTFMDLINTNLSIENTAAIMESLGIVNRTYQEFFENRAAYIVPYMVEEFELTGTREKVTISSNIPGTLITLNTISPELQRSGNAFSWTGDYFTDYPVTVTANAPNFSHWVVTANGRTQTYTDRTIEVPVSIGGVQIHAIST